MMPMQDALRVVEQHRGDALVIPVFSAAWAWPDISQREELDLPFSSPMGKGSSLALGLSMAQPGRKVIVVDGDGSLLMNLGTLATIAEQAPANLYHILLENGVYAITGGQPIPAAGRISFAQLARDAGYAACHEFEHLEDFRIQVPGIFAQRGPVFITLKVEPVARQRRPLPRRTIDAVPGLRKALGT